MSNESILEISGPQTVSQVERQLRLLEVQQPESLLLPVNLKESLLGGQASLIQLICTWGSRNGEATLRTHIQEREDPTTQLANLAKQPFGIVAIWMAYKVTDRLGLRSLKVLANEATDSPFEMMWEGSLKKSDRTQALLFGDSEDAAYEAPRVAGAAGQVFLLSVDHGRWKLPQCYYKSGALRERDDFNLLAHASIERATRLSQTLHESPVPPDLYPSVGAIFHELFKNTHEHGRFEKSGALLRRSVRGIFVGRRNWTDEERSDIASQSPPLDRYLARDDVARDKRVRLIEISVFDSGVGLAAHWRKNEPTLHLSCEEELIACQECLKRWASSTDKPHKGGGLFEVAVTLSKLKAFLRIRTGRLSLFRDFAANPVSEETTNSAIELFDWSTGTSGTLTEMATVSGVLYTMLIPY